MAKTFNMIKTDADLIDEMRQLVDALIGKMAEMYTRDLIVQIGLNNGAQGEPVELTLFKVDKALRNFTKPK